MTDLLKKILHTAGLILCLVIACVFLDKSGVNAFSTKGSIGYLFGTFLGALIVGAPLAIILLALRSWFFKTSFPAALKVINIIFYVAIFIVILVTVFRHH